MKYGLLIKQERERKKLSVKDLEEASGVSESTIRHMEREMHSPSMDNVQKVLEALDLKLKVVRK